MNIVLTGFRATGKSSVGRMLAEKLRYTFIDTDILLCERLGAPIADIVASRGWDFFRQAERRLLMEVTGMVRTVLATGGGSDRTSGGVAAAPELLLCRLARC